MARGFETRHYRAWLSMVSMTRSGRRVEVFVVPSGGEVRVLDNLAIAAVLTSAGGSVQ